MWPKGAILASKWQAFPGFSGRLHELSPCIHSMANVKLTHNREIEFVMFSLLKIVLFDIEKHDRTLC